MDETRHKSTKKGPALFFSLVLADQTAKLLISQLAMRDRFSIIPGFLHFHPVQNRNLSWIASIADYNTPVAQMIVIQIAAAVVTAIVYGYCVFLSEEKQPHLSRFLLFFESGILCSFLDVVFWGGSLDFIALLNWFVFDVKDVYLSLGVISLLLFCMDDLQKYYRLNKEERNRLKKQRGFFQWIKELCRADGNPARFSGPQRRGK